MPWLFMVGGGGGKKVKGGDIIHSLWLSLSLSALDLACRVALLLISPPLGSI